MSKSKRKSPGFWKSEENVLAEVRRILEEHGLDSLPCGNKLAELGYSNLASAIHKYHGRFRKFRKLLGEKQKKVEDGLWQNLDYTLTEARKVMDEHGFDSLPSDKKLAELGYSGLKYAITKYHGGFHNFRKLLGEEQRNVEHGMWQDLDYTLDQAMQVMKEHGFDNLPTQNKLFELGHSSLSAAIISYHSGFRKFRELLGEEQKQREAGVWKDLKYTFNQARQVMKEHGFDTLPNGDKLRELGYSSLSVAITKYHGGFPHFRKLLNQELGIPSEREKLEKVLRGYVKE